MPPSAWIASIVFHGLLTLWLWFVVFQTPIRQTSIALTAAPAKSSGGESPSLGQSRLEVEAPWGKRANIGTEEPKVATASQLDSIVDKLAFTYCLNYQSENDWFVERDSPD